MADEKNEKKKVLDNKIKLSRPVKIGDKEVTEIVLNLDALTGDDIEQVELEMQAQGRMAAVPETSKVYLMHIAARAAGVAVEDIRALPIKDVSRITVTVQNFLLG